MSDLVSITRKQLLRSQLLHIGAEIGTSGGSLQLYKTTVNKFGESYSTTEVEEELDYLEGKGLMACRIVENRAAGIRRVIYRLTPLGVDVLEGTTEVVGVEVGGCS